MNSRTGVSGIAPLVLLLAVAIVMGLVVAQQGNGGDVLVAEHETHGAYLTAAEGNALYLFTNDEPYTSNCIDQCAQNWPPLTIEGMPTAGDGVEIVQLGTIRRADGTRQVTYAGWPLYTFARDESAGDVNGQGANEVWYLVSPEGEPIGAAGDEEAAAEPAGEADAAAAAPAAEGEQAGEAPAEGEVTPELMAAGEQVYDQNCASCHGGNGRGVVGPALAGNRALADDAAVARQIVHGRDEMPPFGGILDDVQIAAVGTFIRNSWGNDFGPLTEEQVAEQR